MRVKWPSFFMTKLIGRSAPQFFAETWSGSYDQHDYKVVTTTNSYVFDNYEDMRNMWWNYDSSMLKHVEVLDKPKQKKGFG